MNARPKRLLPDLWEWLAAGAVSALALASLVTFLVLVARQAGPATKPACATAGACQACPRPATEPVSATAFAGMCQGCRRGAAVVRGAGVGVFQKLSREATSLEAREPAPRLDERLAALSLAGGVVLLWLVSLMLIGNPLAPLRRAVRPFRPGGGMLS